MFAALAVLLFLVSCQGTIDEIGNEVPSSVLTEAQSEAEVILSRTLFHYAGGRGKAPSDTVLATSMTTEFPSFL